MCTSVPKECVVDYNTTSMDFLPLSTLSKMLHKNFEQILTLDCFCFEYLCRKMCSVW